VHQAIEPAATPSCAGLFWPADPSDAPKDAWGNLESGASTPGYAFTGREWDPETGLYYYRARYYDPKAGRFLGEDPIGFQGGVNFYAYVGSNPSSLRDPYGLDPWPDARDRGMTLGQWLGDSSTSAGERKFAFIDDGIVSADEDLLLLTGLGVSAARSLAARAAAQAAARAAAEEASCVLARAGVQLSQEAVRRMAQRGVTRKMIETALSKGARYWDPKNKSVNFIIENGFASGKDLLVGQNPVTGVITTVIRGADLVASRMIPLP
jgi:RHS repeat-associated protein